MKINYITLNNFLTFEEVKISFHDGFNIISGESGSGKSTVFEALLFCLGISSSNIKTNGTVEISILYNGTDYIIKRSLDSKNSAILNGKKITLKELKNFTQDITLAFTNFNTYELFNTKNHIIYLDTFSKHDAYLKEIEALYTNFTRITKEIDLLSDEINYVEQNNAFLLDSIDELKKAHLLDNEEFLLIEKKAALNNNKKAHATLLKASHLINDEKLVEKANQVLKALYNNKDIESLSVIYECMNTAVINLEEVSVEIKSALGNIKIDEIKDIEERIYFLHDLARKYKVTPNDLFNYLHELQNRLSSINELKTKVSKLIKDKNSIENDYITLANKLSESRKAKAKMLESEIESVLSELDLKNARFYVEIKSNEDKKTKLGIDSVLFKASFNNGSSVHNVCDVSGGEASRLMLSLSLCFNSVENKILLLDEIDSGLSGNQAYLVAKKLLQSSLAFQIISISHQAQMCSVCDNHILITKQTKNDKARSFAKTLNQQERVEEIARIVSGDMITKEAIDLANSLLAKSAAKV